jgi:hypothetical protein
MNNIFEINLYIYTVAWSINVATLVLGSRPKQGFAKVRAKSEARDSHFMLKGM